MYYFAYGMNTNIISMTNRTPRAKCLGMAKLPFYRFRFAYHADIIPDRTSNVYGVLWDITEECQRILDQIEGYPNYYNICEVDVLHNGKIYTAETYYMNPGIEDDSPSDHYLQMVLEGYKQNHVPTAQIERALKMIDSDNKLLDKFKIS